MTRLVTSPNVLHLCFPKVESVGLELFDLALDAAVAAVTPPLEAVVIDEQGLVFHVAILEGCVLAFS